MQIGPNILCYALIDGQPSLVLRVEHQCHATGAFECRDETTGARYTFFSENLMPISSVPSRFSKHMFDGVAHIIGAALDAYPNRIEASPGTFAIETFARRVREAKEAKSRYPHYKHPAVDDAKFAKFAHLLRTRIMEVDGQPELWIGPREALDNSQKGTKVKLDTVTGNEILIDAKNPENLERLVRLKHDRVFDPLPNFVVTNITPQQIESLEQRYDVAFVPFEGKPDKYQIL